METNLNLESQDELRAAELREIEIIKDASRSIEKARNLKKEVEGNKTPSSLKRKLGIGLASLIGVGGIGYGVKEYISEKKNGTTAETTETAATKKETNDFYTAPAGTNMTAELKKVAETNLTEEAAKFFNERVKEEKRLAEVAKIQAKIEKNLASTNLSPAALATSPEIAHTPAKTESASVTPKPETVITNKPPTIEEITEKIKAEIQAKFDKESAERQVEVDALKAKIAEAIEASKQTQTPAPKTPEPKAKMTYAQAKENARLAREEKKKTQVMKIESWPAEGAVITSRGEGGANYVYNSNPRGIGFGDPVLAHTQEMITQNPYRLSAKKFEKVKEVYENNLEKIFPGNNILEVWPKIKNGSVYELMNTEDQVDPFHQPIFNYLKILNEETGEKFKSGISGGRPQTIEQYIWSALGNAASKDKKLKLLDSLKL